MSVTAGLIRYPAKVYDQVKVEGTFYPPNCQDIQQCYLSRSWDTLHWALRSFGPPLSLALSGDYGFDGGLNQFGWDEENESDHYLGFVSPTLVAEITSLLHGLSFDQLSASLTKNTRGTDYLAPWFYEMVEFYTATAAGGDCIFIHVA